MKFQNELLIILTIVIMTGAPLAVNADVYKCVESNSKIIYQPHPCTKDIGQRVEIQKRSAEKDAQEAAKLQIWEHNYAARASAEKEVARINQEKEQEYRMREAEVNAANERAETQANQNNLLNKINKKLNYIGTQQMLNNNEQQLYNMKNQRY